MRVAGAPLGPLLGKGQAAPRIIALLTSTRGAEIHTRELIRRLGLSERPVQLALVRLGRRGLVQSRRVGNLRLWRMDPQHPLFAPLRELTAKTVGVIARLRQIVGGKPDVELAFVFGSYAANEDDTTSDIDVLVLGSPNWTLMDREVQRLDRDLRREINVVGWSESDLARAVKTRSYFLETLLRAPKIWILGDENEFKRRIRAVGREASRDRPANGGRSGGSAGRGASEGRTRQAEPRTGTKKPRRTRS